MFGFPAAVIWNITGKFKFTHTHTQIIEFKTKSSMHKCAIRLSVQLSKIKK